MPDKPLTIATYAAGASLAAITLVYVFGPTFFLDDNNSSSSKNGVVGLTNAANDCFINSVLQALAGLPDLRLYLIRETHRRRLDGSQVYDVDPEKVSFEDGGAVQPDKLEGLQKGIVTIALKQVLDKLNERPIYKKTISPQPFIRALERGFGAHISRQQQDAQEFLQILTERLCDEYHAGKKARRQSQRIGLPTAGLGLEETDTADQQVDPIVVPDHADDDKTAAPAEAEESPDDEEEGFPFEGKTESQIECLTCGFKPKPSSSTFVTLTLNVPQQSSTTLNSCFDTMLKREYIEDFKCDRCRLEHAIQTKYKELQRTTTPETRAQLQSEIQLLQTAIESDPENPPPSIPLPDPKHAPRRRIARHMYISSFPKVLAIHLSRSMFALGSVSTKNLAKVSFPETLPLGGLLSQRKYRLLGIITHKGSHNSGHYESFRRQVTPAPYSTPHSFGAGGAYSGSPRTSAVNSPRLSAAAAVVNANGNSASPPISSRSSFAEREGALPSPSTSTPQPPLPAPSPKPPSLRSLSLKSKSKSNSKSKTESESESKAKAADLKRKTKGAQRWWRISDDKVKESKTSEVLGMQKEVYLLFYELER